VRLKLDETMNVLNTFAHDPADDEETRLEKITILLVAGACTIAGMIWTAMYWSIFGWGLTTALPMAFFLIVGAALALAHFTRNHFIAVYAQIICIIYIPAFIQWSVGGVFDSGFVMVWALLGPIGALMFFPWRRASLWFLAFVVNLIVTVVFNDFFAAQMLPVSDEIRLLFFTMNLGFGPLTIFVFATYHVSSARDERQKANRLLLNVLPKEIAPALKDGVTTIAEHFDAASVMFADIVGSTPMFTELEPGEAVDWLNEAFSMFDGLVEKYGVEKIRTVGDNYMVAAGVPVPRPDHAHALAHLALDMLEGLENLPSRNGKRLAFRIGINSGPMVGGVIGQSKFHYDVYGDTVNLASRMESTGEAGKVQVSGATYELIKDAFECSPRGAIEVKGKGEMRTWFLARRK
jgi:guanylate cyclase